MTINALREKRAKALNAAMAFLDAHRNDKGILSVEDDATYSRMEQEIIDLGKEISRMERLEAVDKEMSKATSTPLTAKPDSAKADTKVGRASDEYATAFWNHTRAKHDTMMPEVRNTLKVGVDTEGGYLVPDTFEKTLVQALGHDNVVRSTLTYSRPLPVATKSPL